MAEGWTTQVAAAAGVAALTGAAQLGLGYGLGAVVWPATGSVDDSVWLGSLGWATWIAASSTVFGAVVASRFQSRTGGPWRFALAASAAVGALLAVALTALPARAAVRPDTFSAETVAGGYASLGVLLGLAVAYWAVVSRPVAANVVATAAWLWALAVAGIVVELTGRPQAEPFLGGWQLADQGAGSWYGVILWPSALLALVAALIIGAIGALPAVRRGELSIGAAASGAVGPLLVAATFFVLAPQLTGALGALESAYLIAPYAVLTGLAGSAATVALGRRVTDRRQPRVVASERARARTATGTAAVPRQAPAAEPEPDPRQQPTAQQRTAVPPARNGRDRGDTAQRTAPTPLNSPPTAPAPVGPPPVAPPPVTPRPRSATQPARSTTAKPPPATDAKPRSTVAPPPAAPPVANINPTRSGDSTSGGPAAPSPDRAGPAQPPTTKSANRGPSSPASTTSPTQAATPPAKATPPASPTSPTQAATPPAKATPPPAKAASPSETTAAPASGPAKAARARPRVTKAGPANTEPHEGTPPQGKPPAAATAKPAPAAAKPAEATPPPAAPAKVSPSARTPTAKKAAADAAPPPPADGDGSDEPPTAELWVDDASAPSDPGTKRGGLRRFGRRSTPDDPGSDA